VSAAGGARPTLVGTADASIDLLPTYPAGIVAGDRLVYVQGAVAESAGNVTGVTFGSDGSWSVLVAAVSGTAGGRDVVMQAWHKTAAGTETGTVAGFTRTGGSQIADTTGIFVVRGASATLDNSASNTGSDDPITAPALTVAAANRLGMLATLFGDDVGALGNYTGGSGTDFTALDQAQTNTGVDRRLGLHTANLDAGVSSKQEATTRSADSWVVIGMVFAPT
jgi:hypothetical protein